MWDWDWNKIHNKHQVGKKKAGGGRKHPVVPEKYKSISLPPHSRAHGEELVRAILRFSNHQSEWWIPWERYIWTIVFYDWDAFRHKQLKLGHTDIFAFSGTDILLGTTWCYNKEHEWRTNWDYRSSFKADWEKNARPTECISGPFQLCHKPITSHSALNHLH